MHGGIVDVFAEDARGSGRGKNQAHQKLQGCSFASAICAQEAEDLSALDIQRQAVERAHFALAPESGFVVLREVVYFNREHSLQRGTFDDGSSPTSQVSLSNKYGTPLGSSGAPLAASIRNFARRKSSATSRHDEGQRPSRLYVSEYLSTCRMTSRSSSESSRIK